MTKVELKNVTKTFINKNDNYTEAVTNLSFTVQDGEFVVLVGPSGCGKTTTLRLIAGLESPTSGDILFDDVVVNKLQPAERNIGMVFQEYALYPHLSVFENVAFPLRVQNRSQLFKKKNKLSKTEIKDKTFKILEQLELVEYANRTPKQLSGGQRQRVALGRALIREPKLFLFDEPLSNLDPRLRITLRQELIKLHRKLGITSIYVTHDQIEAMTMGNKIVLMNKGVLQQYDTPANLYNNPRNLFIADFIGSPTINIFEGKMKDDLFEEKDSCLALPLIKMLKHNQYHQAIKNGSNDDIEYHSISIGNEVRQKLNEIGFIAIRPEKIKLGTNNDRSWFNFQCKVDNIEFIGNESIIYFNTGKNINRILAPPTQDIVINQTIDCCFSIESLYFFDNNKERIYISN